MANVEGGEDGVLAALEDLKRLTHEMKKSLLRSRVRDFGMLLHQAWGLKRVLASGISDPGIDALYESALGAGAIGGKLLGAGGGGYLLVFVPFNKRNSVRNALETAGGRVVDFQFDHEGAKSWAALDETWTE
jgi:D-glycero-alpha-D-manno-heptose-7-phosphate kinase